MDRMTTHTYIRETPFRLTIGQEAIIPVEIDQILNYVSNFLEEVND